MAMEWDLVAVFKLHVFYDQMLNIFRCVPLPLWFFGEMIQIIQIQSYYTLIVSVFLLRLSVHF